MISTPPRRIEWTPASAEEHAEVLQALEDVIASPYFCNSKRYLALLRYVVEQTLLGHGDEIKERTVGIDVFGRTPDYDTNIDTVVRYSVGEVRKRLALYYHEAAEAPVVISLTPRSYRPEFLRLAEPSTFAGTETVEDVEPITAGLVVVTRESRHLLAWSVAAIAVLILLLVGIYSWNSARTDAGGRFWSPVIDQKSPTIISLGGVTFSPGSNTGTEPASDPTNITPYFSFENGLAMDRVAALVNG